MGITQGVRVVEIKVVRTEARQQEKASWAGQIWEGLEECTVLCCWGSRHYLGASKRRVAIYPQSREARLRLLDPGHLLSVFRRAMSRTTKFLPTQKSQGEQNWEHSN